MAITFSFSGTLGTTFSFMNYNYWTPVGAYTTISTIQGSLTTVNFASVSITTPASGAARIFKFKGIARNNGGAIVPQITFGTAGTANTLSIGSYIKFSPISSINSTSIGPVS